MMKNNPGKVPPSKISVWLHKINTHYLNPRKLLIQLIAILFFVTTGAQAAGNFHDIEMFAERLEDGLFAYGMRKHKITDQNGQETDLTGRYIAAATIPGPTIVMEEGDVAEIELVHQFDPENPFQDHVSLHVHGVHYDLISDGTLKYINFHSDQSAMPAMSYTYRWDAAPGTAGTWPYHDHNMESHNGAEDKGLFGTLIVNPASGTERINFRGTRANIPLSRITKDYVFYIGDDAFWGMEIDNATGKQTYLGINPSLTAQRNTYVRFHLIALGTNFHQFELANYSWVDPGKSKRIKQKVIGPLEKHVFAIRATHSSSYMDTAFSSSLLGMKGNFIVTD
jgi:FtsP/CotA-like multicopper oxidase with cupredoxin domain